MKILFVCKHNRFRSKVAETIFNKLNKNTKIKAESAGLKKSRLVSKNVKNFLKEKGFKLTNINSRKINQELVKKFDLIIIVADNVNKKTLEKFNKKIIIWKIPDTDNRNIKEVKDIIKKIESKINKFVKRFIKY